MAKFQSIIRNTLWPPWVHVLHPRRRGSSHEHFPTFLPGRLARGYPRRCKMSSPTMKRLKIQPDLCHKHFRDSLPLTPPAVRHWWILRSRIARRRQASGFPFPETPMNLHEIPLSCTRLSPIEEAGGIASTFHASRNCRVPSDWPSPVTRFLDRGPGPTHTPRPRTASQPVPARRS